MYGSLTALIMLMLWLYSCMYLVLCGAEINAYFEKQFRMAQASMREMLNREKAENDDGKETVSSDAGQEETVADIEKEKDPS